MNKWGLRGRRRIFLRAARAALAKSNFSPRCAHQEGEDKFFSALRELNWHGLNFLRAARAKGGEGKFFSALRAPSWHSAIKIFSEPRAQRWQDEGFPHRAHQVKKQAAERRRKKEKKKQKKNALEENTHQTLFIKRAVLY